MHFRQFVLFSILFIFNDTLIAQCPPNLDFEEGTFNHWNFRNGITKVVNYQNVIQYTGTQQIPGRQDIIAANPFPGYDYYGNFPKSCPNGSNYSIKLGDDIGKHQAEGVYYTFTIPDSTPRFSLIYHYALVFQDPGHASYEQPRLQIQVINLTDFDTVACPSFSFVATSNLPGFILSPRSTAKKNIITKIGLQIPLSWIICRAKQSLYPLPRRIVCLKNISDMLILISKQNVMATFRDHLIALAILHLI